jgi:ABC-type multidrug transport system permease subunit
MDYVLSFIVDLIIDEELRPSNSSKLPKGLRYFLFALVLIIYVGIIGLITMVGITSIKDNLVEGIIAFILALCILVVCILRFKEVYSKKTKNKKNSN